MTPPPSEKYGSNFLKSYKRKYEWWQEYHSLIFNKSQTVCNQFTHGFGHYIHFCWGEYHIPIRLIGGNCMFNSKISAIMKNFQRHTVHYGVIVKSVFLVDSDFRVQSKVKVWVPQTQPKRIQVVFILLVKSYYSYDLLFLWPLDTVTSVSSRN